jgi:uncharacterized protein YfiM (DUF2279 family)
LTGVSLHSFGQDTIAVPEKISFLQPSPVYSKQRAQIASYSTLALYAGTMSGLYQLWYSQYDLTGFHFFNDNNEWLQMDKAGHTFSAYIAGRQGYNVCRWTGLDEQHSALIGGNLGWVFLASVEVLDGFSKGWGFSIGDMAANTIGSAMFISQQLTWHEQRMELKVSFHQTKYAHYRPDLLGENYTEQLLKDYNGQTLWLSGNIKSFLAENYRCPTWLNIAIGYGAEGMTGAFANIIEFDNQPAPSFKRCRQFYLSPDIDFTKIKTQSKFLKFIFETTRFIKVPLPALELNTKGQWKFHAVYF